MFIIEFIMAHKALRSIALIVIAVIALISLSEMLLKQHDTTIISKNNAMWSTLINKGLWIKTSHDTIWVDEQLPPPATQSKPGRKINIPEIIQHAIDSAKASWTATNANKDSLLEEYTAPRSAQFEDILQTHDITYQPIGDDIPFKFTLHSTPKPRKIPIITNTNTIAVNADIVAYKPFALRPRLHGDIFPFTPEGLQAGGSLSLFTYGTSPEAKNTLFYFPSIGLATDMKNAFTVHAGIRLNIGYFIGGIIQDTHIIGAYGINTMNGSGIYLIGIGTGL